MRWTAAMAAALILSACGAPQAAQSFVREHTQCLPAYYGSPEWSSDGLLIYYSVTAGFMYDIHVMRGDGGGDRLLVRGGFDPMPSPDGTRLLFANFNPAAAQNPNGSGKYVYDYYVLDLGSPKVGNPVATGFAAAWSPDSRWIAYGVGPQLNGPLKKTNVLTGKTIQLTETPDGALVWDAYPVWSPDGQRIAFTSNRAGQIAIYLVDAVGGDISRIPGTVDPDCQPVSPFAGDVPEAWLPAGDVIVTTRMCGTYSGIRLVNPSGEVVGEWENVPGFSQYDQVSPDGKQILYGARDVVGFPVLNIASLEGSNPRLLQPNAWSPRWSPDGRRIVFEGFDAVNLEAVFIINADGSGLTQLTRNPGAGKVCLH